MAANFVAKFAKLAYPTFICHISEDEMAMLPLHGAEIWKDSDQ